MGDGSYLIRRVLAAVLAFVSLQALTATQYLALRAAVPYDDARLFGFALVSTLTIGAALWYWKRGLRRQLARIISFTQRLHKNHWLAVIIILGFALRSLWAIVYPAAPASDGRIYLELAEKLAQGRSYEVGGALAYWPPGYPLLLSPLAPLFDNWKLVVFVLNSLCFVIAVFLTYSLGQAIAGDSAGKVASAFIAFWPTLITMTGLPEKELVLVAVIPLAFYLYFETGPEGGRARMPFIAGLTLGAASLIQPSFVLLPTAVALADWLRGDYSLWSIVKRLGLLIVGMALVISPWTIRNALVFDQFVLISSNGGYNLYRANNELATGGYLSHGAVDLESFGELERSEEGRRLAVEWIRSHPSDFVELVIEKQMRFLGDDSTGVYASLRRGELELSEAVYLFWKGMANGYWMILWVPILFWGAHCVVKRQPLPKAVTPHFLGFLYLYSIHSVFESDGKYHIPVLSLLAVLAAYSIHRGAKFGTAEDVDPWNP